MTVSRPQLQDSPPAAPGSAGRLRRALPLLVILAVGLAIRIIPVLVGHHFKPAGDALFYHLEANFLVEGRGWSNPLQVLAGHRGTPTAAFPPLFTLVLSVSSLVGFKSFFAHRIWSGVVGTVGVALAAGLGRSISGRKAALWAAGLAAVYPNLWMSNNLALSETISPVLVLGLLWAGYAFWKSPSVKRALLLGVVLGLAILGRDELLLLGPLAVLPLALGRRRSWPDRGRFLASAVLASGLVVGPWVGYNLSRFQDPVFVSDGLGVTLASANCNQTWYGPDAGYWSLPCAAAVPYKQTVDESVQGAEAQSFALHYIGTHLGGLPRIEAIRLGRAFGVYRPIQQIDLDVFIEGRPRVWAFAGLGMYYCLVPLAIAGAVVLRRRGLPLYPVLAVLADVVVSVLLTFGQTRYRSTLEPVLVVLAAVAIAGWRRKGRTVTGARGEETAGVLVLDGAAPS